MKVILTEEIHGLGGRGEVVTVRDGYARNYLLPKNLAKLATEGNMKAVEQQRKKWSELSAKEKNEASKMAQSLEGTRLSVTKKVGESGTLFGSVTAADIAQALAENGMEIDRRRIQIGEAIKTAGEHKVEVRLHREVTATVVVDVVPDTAKTGASSAPLPGTAGHAQAAASNAPAEETAEGTEGEETPAAADEASNDEEVPAEA